MRRLTFLFLILLLLTAGVSALQETKPQNTDNRPKVEGKLWWIFLNTGKTPSSKFTKEEVQKWQQEHVGNFGERYKEGRLFAAGPLGDNGFIRGIVVVKAKDMSGVMDCFKTDPFVQKGLLDVEALPIMANESAFKKADEPFVIEQFTLVIFKKGTKWSEKSTPEMTKLQGEHLKGLSKLMKEGELAFASPIVDDKSEKRGICIFWSKDDKAVKEHLDKDPLVIAGHLTYETHPQFMGRGTFGERPKKG